LVGNPQKKTPDMPKAPKIRRQSTTNSRQSAHSQNRSAVNAGRAIMNNNSNSVPPASKKPAPPRASDIAQLKPREERNYVKGNFNHAAYEMKAKEMPEEKKQFAHKNQGKVP